MTINNDAIQARLQRIQRSHNRLVKIVEEGYTIFEDDEDIQVIAERHLQLIAQAIADIAAHIIAQEKWGTPESYRAAIELIAKKKVISQDLGNKLASVMGLRNILIHDYLIIQSSILFQELEEGLNDFTEFTEQVNRFLHSRSSRI
ncbi:MAG: DUF86 domain-containing protein [Promethearchaeota archaeon]